MSMHRMWLWVKTNDSIRSHFGVGAPPILVGILVGIGMFTGGTIWILTHGHVFSALLGPFKGESPSLATPTTSFFGQEPGAQEAAKPPAAPEAPARSESNGHGSKSQARTPSEHPNPTTKIGAKMGPKWVPLVLTHSQMFGVSTRWQVL